MTWLKYTSKENKEKKKGRNKERNGEENEKKSKMAGRVRGRVKKAKGRGPQIRSRREDGGDYGVDAPVRKRSDKTR